jgi:hypothetical protein
MPYGTERTVGAEPTCVLGCVRFGKYGLGYNLLGWIR